MECAYIGADMREEIRDEVEAISPFDDIERDHIADVLAWIDSGAELFRQSKPADPPKHLVSYFAIVDEQHLLLVDHKNARLWLPPGGHVEPGENPRMTVLREMQEELRLSPTQPIGPPFMITCNTTVGLSAKHVDVSLWYVVNVPRSQNVWFDESEFHAARWFPISEAPVHRSDPNLSRFLAKLDSTFPQHAPFKMAN